MEYDTTSGISSGLTGALSGAAMGSVIPGIGTLAGGAVGGIAGLLGGMRNKVKKPSIPTGQQTGQYAKDYFDTLAPGTTPWERIGANNPAGGIESSNISSQTETNVTQSERNQQNRQLATQNAMEMAKLALEKQRVKNETNLTASEVQRNKTGVIGQGVNAAQNIPKELGIVGAMDKSVDWFKSGINNNFIDKNTIMSYQDYLKKYKPAKYNTGGKGRKVSVKVNGR